jgi:hypothetical protein
LACAAAMKAADEANRAGFRLWWKLQADVAHLDDDAVGIRQGDDAEVRALGETNDEARLLIDRRANGFAVRGHAGFCGCGRHRRDADQTSGHDQPRQTSRLRAHD